MIQLKSRGKRAPHPFVCHSLQMPAQYSLATRAAGIGDRCAEFCTGAMEKPEAALALRRAQAQLVDLRCRGKHCQPVVVVSRDGKPQQRQ
ncbi:MAG: hypothetical protein ACRC9K_16125 [Afipia sp.]